MPSIRRNLRALEWDCRSAVRLSKLTEDGCGRRQMRPEAPSFSSRCQFVRIKNAVEHLDYELRQLWLFAPSWAGDIEQVDDVIVQESFQPLRCVWQPDWPPET